MADVVYDGCFVPAEWIAAHGFSPRRLIPGVAESTATGLCPYAAGFTAAARRSEAAAVVATTACDQMRRAVERYLSSASVPLFLMHVPATWETPGVHRLYREELLRLGRFLVSLGGTTPSSEALAATMKAHEQRRHQYGAAAPFLSAREYAEARIAFHEHGQLPAPSSLRSAQAGPAPLALVGGPLLREHLRVFEIIEAVGGAVVLDATDHGERGFPAPFDVRALSDDPLGCLVNAYFGAIPDAFRRPNDALYRWLEARLATSGARGIVFVHYLWCDTWHAEAERLRQWSPIPVLILDLGDDPLPEQARTRLEAFVEMLR